MSHTQILERALSTGDDSCIFSVCNKIIELLDPEQSSQVYTTVCGEDRYRGLYKGLEANAAAHLSNVQGPAGSSLEAKDDAEYHTGVGAVVQAALGAEVAGLATEMVGVFGSVFGISRSSKTAAAPPAGNAVVATPVKPSPPSSSSGTKTPGTAVKSSNVRFLSSVSLPISTHLMPCYVLHKRASKRRWSQLYLTKY
jgi:hypothetical protein